MAAHNVIDKIERAMASGDVLDIALGDIEATSLDVNTIVPSTGSQIAYTATTHYFTGDVTVEGGAYSNHATGGMGYSAGAGGTVTQGSGSGKATAATLSKVCGAITMDGASLGAATIVSFVLTNTAIVATDVLVLNHISGGTVGSYTLNAQCANGSATINVRNNTAGALSEAIVIQFAIVRAVNA